MAKHHGIILALAALPLWICSCSQEGNHQETRKATAAPVTTVTVTNALWDRTVSVVGTLFPKDEALISAQVEGMVERTLVDFGDRVQNNQELAFIDTTTYQAQLQQAAGLRAKAEAGLTNDQRNFERVLSLRDKNIASMSELDAARAQLDQAQAELQAELGAESVAQLNLAHSRVQAPFDGAVAQRLVGRGDYVKSGSPLFNVVNDSVLKFIFQVPERHASFVVKKLPVSFNVDNYPGETFTGSVYLISPAVSTANRSFSVGALVTNLNHRLKASTFARGTLVLEKGLATPMVPLISVVSFAGVTKVFIVENNVARSRTVVLGRIRDGAQEVLEGLKAGERVVTSGQSKLSDGMAVEVKDLAPATAPANH